MSNLNLEHLRQWIGRGEEAADAITPHLVLRLRATLFREAILPMAGESTPLTTHWCLAPTVVSSREIAQDGHPAKGGFLPPVPLPRRDFRQTLPGCKMPPKRKEASVTAGLRISVDDAAWRY